MAKFVAIWAPNGGDCFLTPFALGSGGVCGEGDRSALGNITEAYQAANRRFDTPIPCGHGGGYTKQMSDNKRNQTCAQTVFYIRFDPSLLSEVNVSLKFDYAEVVRLIIHVNDRLHKWCASHS